MSVYELLNRKSFRYAVYKILILLTAFFVYRIFIAKPESVFPFVHFLFDSYLLLIERLINGILLLSGSSIMIEYHIISMDNVQFGTVGFDVLMKNWLVLIMVIFWITPSSCTRKILFTAILLAVNLLGTMLAVYFLVHLNTSGYDYSSASNISRTPGILFLVFIFFIWLRRHNTAIVRRFSKLQINADIIDTKFYEIIFIICFYIITRYLIASLFDFRIWVDMLLIPAQKILILFDYEAYIEPYHLIGPNGTIVATKECLGISTMVLFVSLVYLTGRNTPYLWIFIGSGLILLNVINIFRFVILFIHLQKYGDRLASLYVHDIYNYFIYTIVFVLWIVWFEKFSNINLIVDGSAR